MRLRLLRLPRKPAGEILIAVGLDDLKALLSGPPEPSEPVAWTGNGSLAAIAAGREGFIWGSAAPSHPIALYASPVPATEPTEEEVARVIRGVIGAHIIDQMQARSAAQEVRNVYRSRRNG